MKRTSILWASVLLAPVCLYLVLRSGDVGRNAPPIPAASAAETDALSLPESSTESRTHREELREESPASPPTLDAAELLAALEALAAVDFQKEEAANAALRPLLLDPDVVRAALDLLVSGKLKTHPTVLSPGEIGAIRLVWIAVATYNTSALAEDMSAAGFHVDGRAFTEEVLEALASIENPAADALANLLAGLHVEGQQVIDRSYLELIRRLASNYPDREDLFGLFLAQIGDQEDLEFNLQFLSLEEDPQLLKSRLVAAFEKADRAQALQLLQWIEQAYGEAAEDVQLDLAQAVAAAAPPSLAARFLVERASEYMLGQFDTLGLRPAGQEVLTGEYNNLLAAGTNPKGRKMIVSGLAAGGVATLIGIAETDPDQAVRGQAILTATWASDFEPTSGFLQKVREGYIAGGALQGIPHYATISTAYNLLLRAKEAGNNVLATETVQFLKGLAVDPSISAYDRDKIPGNLQNHIPLAEWEALKTAVKATGSK